MKKTILWSLLMMMLISSMTIVSCNQKPQEDTSNTSSTTTVEPEKKPEHVLVVDVSELFTAKEISLLTQNLASVNLAAKGKPVKLPKQVNVVPASMTLISNGNNSYTFDYNGATNVVQVFFRGGDSLYSNGNVYPANTQPFSDYPNYNPVTTFTAWSTMTGFAYYQGVVITGTWDRDENGVLGANWVVTYTNKL